MRVGDTLKKERERKGISTQDMAAKLGISERQYQQLEEGNSAAEKWGPALARIAIKLQTPVARLISETGKSAQVIRGRCGEIIKRHREKRGVSIEHMATSAGLPREEYEEMERAASSIEEFGPLLLRFAEQIEQPMFNLFYPCGLPLEKLEDYP